jgi:hypothetical protein
MPDPTLGMALIGAALIGLLSLLVILRRQRRDRELRSGNHPFAVATEGSKRCPTCGMGNLWTSTRCISCGSELPG